MSNIIAATLVLYGLISISFAISFAPQSNTNSHEEKVARVVVITFWPVAVYATIHTALEAKKHEPSEIKDIKP